MSEITKNNAQLKLEETFKDLSENFTKTDNKVEQIQKEFEQKINTFNEAVNSDINFPVKDSSYIMKVFSSIHQSLKKDSKTWIEKITQSAINKNFRDKYNDSMLIYVYGKVKTGKSALGNFIAYGNIDPSKDYIQQYGPIDFDIEQGVDDNTSNEVQKEKIKQQRKSTQQEHRFMVEFEESTACIQLFKKTGLTWIDSPGIHSTTESNGALAKKYLGAADLVVYATNARSAMTESDQKELVEIIKSKKPFLIVATRCDEPDIIDFDENGKPIKVNKMFPQKDIDEIKDWIVDSMGTQLKGISEDRKPTKSDVLALSCLYAQEHLLDDEFSNSGLGAFFEKLQEIAKAEGLKIKQKYPLQALYKNIIDVKDSINFILGNGQHQKSLYTSETISDLQNTRKTLNDFVKSTRDKCKRSCNQCKMRLEKEVMAIAEATYQNKDNETFKAKLLERSKQIISDVLQDFDAELSNDSVNLASSFSPNFTTEQIKEFDDIKQYYTYHTSSKKGWGGFFGSIVGTIGGFLVGGPVGAAVGATAGVLAGGGFGSVFDGDKSNYTVVGDNHIEVARQTVVEFQNQVEHNFENLQKAIEDTYITPLTQWLNSLEKEITSLDAYLDEQLKMLKEEL